MSVSQDYLVTLHEFAKKGAKVAADENLRGIIDGVDKVTGVLGEVIDNKKSPIALILPGAALLSKIIDVGLGKPAAAEKSGSVDQPASGLVTAAVAGLPEFLKMAPPMLQNLQAISSLALGVGVLNLAVSVAGFVAIRGQLRAMDKKLDKVLTKLEEIHDDVKEIKDNADRTRDIELEATFKNLELVIREKDPKKRRSSMTDNCLFNFQRLRASYQHASRKVWENEQLSTERAVSLYNSYLLSAIGYIQSVIMCDFSVDSLERNIREISHELDDINQGIVVTTSQNNRKIRKIDISNALKMHSKKAIDRSLKQGIGELALFHGSVPSLENEFASYAALIESSYRRIDGYNEYPELAENIKISIPEILAFSADAKGENVYVLRPRGLLTSALRLFIVPE